MISIINSFQVLNDESCSFYLVIFWWIGVDGMQNLDCPNVSMMRKFVKCQNSFCPDRWIGVNLIYIRCVVGYVYLFLILRVHFMGNQNQNRKVDITHIACDISNHKSQLRCRKTLATIYIQQEIHSRSHFIFPRFIAFSSSIRSEMAPSLTLDRAMKCFRFRNRTQFAVSCHVLSRGKNQWKVYVASFS